MQVSCICWQPTSEPVTLHLQATAAPVLLCRFVPDLQWIERCYRQASKHLHAAEPGDVCALIWAWGAMGYIPRDILFLNQVRDISMQYVLCSS
jgi:hypothetical protein